MNTQFVLLALIGWIMPVLGVLRGFSVNHPAISVGFKACP